MAEPCRSGLLARTPPPRPPRPRPYQLVALRPALQLLVVVEGEPVQHGVLLVVHGGHGALLVDAVDVDVLLALQRRAPPVLTRLAQAHLAAGRGRVSAWPAGRLGPRAGAPVPQVPPEDGAPGTSPPHNPSAARTPAHSHRSSEPPAAHAGHDGLPGPPGRCGPSVCCFQSVSAGPCWPPWVTFAASKPGTCLLPPWGTWNPRTESALG